MIKLSNERRNNMLMMGYDNADIAYLESHLYYNDMGYNRQFLFYDLALNTREINEIIQLVFG